LVFCEAMAGKTMPSEMGAATTEMAAATTEASTMPTTSSTMPTASSTVCEHGGGRERQNAGQNQTEQ